MLRTVTGCCSPTPSSSMMSTRRRAHRAAHGVPPLAGQRPLARSGHRAFARSGSAAKPSCRSCRLYAGAAWAVISSSAISHTCLQMDQATRISTPSPGYDTSRAVYFGSAPAGAPNALLSWPLFLTVQHLAPFRRKPATVVWRVFPGSILSVEPTAIFIQAWKLPPGPEGTVDSFPQATLSFRRNVRSVRLT